MPLPTPNKGEKRSDFVSRCMSQIGDEDKPQDQKLAICYSQWKNKKKESKGHVEFADGDEILID